MRRSITEGCWGSVKTHDAQSGVWPWIVAGLLIAGCAADKQQSRVEQAEPDRSARTPIEAPRPPAETPKTASPKGRPTLPTEEQTKKTPSAKEQTQKTPSAQEQTKKTPPAQEQAKKTPPAMPSERRQETTGEERKSGEETTEARQDRPPSELLTDRPRTEAPDEPKGQQQAKLPGDRVTPLHQSGSKDDVETTRRIRQKLMNEDLSFSARNVMVITEEDRVVLKGTVNSPSEAERVKGVAGALTTKQIEDRLQIGGQ